MFDNKEFEPAPSDVTYNFGASAATSIGVKATTYLASALALGGSLFVSNQIMSPANIQRADQANAAGQSQGVADQANDTNADGTAENSSSVANATSAAIDAATAAAMVAAESKSSATNIGTTSHGAKRFAAKSTPSPSATAEASPAPSATAGTTVALPQAPTFSHTNTSSATPSANSSNSGSGSSYGGDEGGDQQESESDD